MVADIANLGAQSAKKTAQGPDDCWFCWRPLKEHTAEQRRKCLGGIRRHRREFK